MPVVVPTPPPVPTDGPVVNDLRIVNMDGSVVESLANFQIDQVQWQLDSMGLLQFTLPTDEPTWTPYGKVGPAFEIQYYRRGLLYWWGVVVDSELQGDGSTTQVTCYGLLWYFHKRFFGTANRVNWIKGYTLDGGFAQPVTQWSEAKGASASVAPTASFPAPPVPLIGQFGNDTDGTGTVVQLAAAGGGDYPAGEDGYYEQSVTFSSGPWTPQAPGATLTAWYYLVSFTGPAAKIPSLGNTQRGLYMALYEVDGTTPIYVKDHDAASGAAVSVGQITNAAQTGTWTRVQAGVIPPNRHFMVKLRLYAPGGKIQWSGLSLTQQDGFYPDVVNVDQALIINRIVTIAQGLDPTWVLMDPTKTDLNIGVNCPNTGIRREASYPFANHQNILDALNDWTTEYQGVDMEVLFPDTHHRWFTTWGTAEKGRKGYFQPKLALVIGGNVIVGNSQLSANTENGGNNVVEIGVDLSTATDNGSANNEGGFTDFSLLGGKDVEIVESAPNDIGIGKLGPLARQRQQSIGGVPLAPVLRCQADDPVFGPIYIGAPGLHVGDTTRLFGDYGWFSFTGETYRVVQIDLYPGSDGDVCDYTLNLPDPYAQVPSPV